MSLSRLALRLAAFEVLCPAASVKAGGPYPTWAGDQVYDSRIDPIADSDGWQTFLASVEGKPIVTIYTEEQDTSPVEGEYPAEIEIVDLVVEIMVAIGASLEIPGKPPEGTIEIPITDARHEATLDVIEHQIRWLLDPIAPPPADANAASARATYLRVARELHHVKSVPMRDATSRLSRQAARTLVFKLRVPRAAPGRPPANAPAALAGLPEPLLSVALALDPLSAGAKLVRDIADGAPPPGRAVPLRDLRIAANLDRNAAPQSEGEADLVSDVPL